MQGRKSGEWRKTPVNLLDHDGGRYLVAPRGTRSGCATCRPRVPASCASAGGSKRSAASRSPTTEKVDVLRDYLRRWKMEVGVFFDGVGPDSTDDELAAIAPKHPVFLVEAV